MRRRLLAPVRLLWLIPAWLWVLRLIPAVRLLRLVPAILRILGLAPVRLLRLVPSWLRRLRLIPAAWLGVLPGHRLTYEAHGPVKDERIPLDGKGVRKRPPVLHLHVKPVADGIPCAEELLTIRSVTNRGGYGEEEMTDAEIMGIIGVFTGLFILIAFILYWASTKRCPKCGKRRAHATREQVLIAATYASAGQGLRTYRCKHCGNTFDVPFVIPRRTHTVIITGGGRGGSFGGGFSGGGSWGGGSTFGGGAGGRW